MRDNGGLFTAEEAVYTCVCVCVLRWRSALPVCGTCHCRQFGLHHTGSGHWESRDRWRVRFFLLRFGVVRGIQQCDQGPGATLLWTEQKLAVCPTAAQKHLPTSGAHIPPQAQALPASVAPPTEIHVSKFIFGSGTELWNIYNEVSFKKDKSTSEVSST